MDTNYKEILENLMHELARINSINKSSSEAISKGIKKGFDKNTVVYHTEMIFENSLLFSTHLDIVNYQLNPAFFSIEAKDKRNIHGKFHKAILLYTRYAKQKEIKIKTSGKIQTLIDTYPVIDTLPILIIDNAIKYSPRYAEIDIEFYESNNYVEVSVSNTGPFLKLEERDKIFQRGYRGDEAKETKLPGQGFGMSFIEHICNIHNADLHLVFSDNITKIDGIKYSEFTLKIQFEK
jgi:signal transduction histidine kinase